MDIATHPEVREAQIISLEQVRARRLPVPYMAPAGLGPRQPFHHPEEAIRAAADLHLADGLLAVVEELVSRLQISQRPMEPQERARLMRASAAMLAQPEGP
jgi:hypothetical protein